jgi:hypothetical protein
MNYWYRFIMAMTREDRRTLTIEAMTSTGRDERIAWAVHALDLGATPSPNLCSLALFSVRRIPSSWEVDDLFRRSLDELGLARPSPEEYLRQHARDVAEGIVSGTVEPLEGAHILHAVAGSLGYPEDLVPWDGFDEDLFLGVGEDGRSLYYEGAAMISYIKQNSRALPHKIPKKYF